MAVDIGEEKTETLLEVEAVETLLVVVPRLASEPGVIVCMLVSEIVVTEKVLVELEIANPT